MRQGDGRSMRPVPRESTHRCGRTQIEPAVAGCAGLHIRRDQGRGLNLPSAEQTLSILSPRTWDS